MKIGLKDTLTLLSKGYSKKDIQELEALDTEEESKESEEPAKAEAPAEDIKKGEPDYKALYEDLLKKSAEDKKALEDMQKDNIRQNMGPDVKKAREEEEASLLDSIRSFM